MCQSRFVQAVWHYCWKDLNISISQKIDQTQHGNLNEADDWSEECLEYLFDNKIWFPSFVRPKNSCKMIFKLNFKLKHRILILIPLLLPFIDVLTDHIFAIQNMIQNNSPAVAAVGCALLLNLVLGPMLFGKMFFFF